MRLAVLYFFSIITLAACSSVKKPASETEVLRARIDSLESVVFEESEAPADRQSGMELVRAYAKFYQANKSDSTSVDMLFKAGEVSMGIGQGNLAVKYFSTIFKDHKDFPKAPESLFLTGFCEENLNNDTADARFYYEKFLSTYPNHKLAKDAKFSIQNLTLSDEDLIKMFEQKSEDNS